MADLALLRIRNHPVLLFSVLYKKVLLWMFALFMIAGNFFRLLQVAHLPSHLSIVEMGLYLLAVPLYFTKVRKSQLLVLGIFLSAGYGTLLNGFDAVSVLYSFKLVGMIATGVVIGRLFSSEKEISSYFLKVFGWILGVGFVIFVVFPKAHIFFALLKGYGIQFLGDPHQRRFISPFFDPNYYAVIACIPLILAFVSKRWVYFGLLLISIFLTFSRSGMATCFILLGAMLLSMRWRLHLRYLMLLPLLSVPFLFPAEMTHLFERSVHLVEDPSALARLETFQVAISYFWQHPFFGVGYHYLSRDFFEAFGRLSPDASVLITLIDFGLIPVLGLVFASVWWSLKHLRRRGLFFWLYFYVALCVLLAGLFNNLLYYQYWLIPVVALFTQLQGGDIESRTRS